MPTKAKLLKNENIGQMRLTTLLGFMNKTVLEVSFCDCMLVDGPMTILTLLNPDYSIVSYCDSLYWKIKWQKTHTKNFSQRVLRC